MTIEAKKKGSKNCRKESGSHTVDMQSHSFLEKKEMDEKPCDEHNYSEETLQTTCNHSSKQTREAFKQSGELRSGSRPSNHCTVNGEPIKRNPQRVTSPDITVNK